MASSSTFHPEALACLRQYRWPGNVREPQRVIKESMLRMTGPILQLQCLPAELRATPSAVAELGEAVEGAAPAPRACGACSSHRGR
jgi:DNA-binding NtrC family response regulator